MFPAADTEFFQGAERSVFEYFCPPPQIIFFILRARARFYFDFYKNQLLKRLLFISNVFLGYFGNYLAKIMALGGHRRLPPLYPHLCVPHLLHRQIIPELNHYHHHRLCLLFQLPVLSKEKININGTLMLSHTKSF